MLQFSFWYKFSANIYLNCSTEKVLNSTASSFCVKKLTIPWKGIFVFINIRHIFWLHSTFSNCSRYINKQLLIGSCEKIYHRRYSSSFSNGHTICGHFCTFTKSTDNIDKNLYKKKIRFVWNRKRIIFDEKWWFVKTGCLRRQQIQQLILIRV